ncbi:hypothetical protein HID58_064537 [Brassica napus]|uniref:Uncharacterized protein n=1 Tax=Brassica napus TaxID=3708 RepID=A0ABQ7ZAB7_BRANA|nr:hypothetical protein HID58_064537 [Brassica napus]
MCTHHDDQSQQNLPCLHCQPHTYIRMVQHMIERCIILRMTRDECVKALDHHASILPLVTLTIWRGLQRENKDFFETWICSEIAEDSVDCVMATDTTASSYWLNWRVLCCALILLAPLLLAAILIWRYEGKRREGREHPGTLFQDEAWSTCFKRVHPRWLLAFRVFSFAAMLSLLVSNVVRDGGGIFYFYTQWTFTLVTLYFGYASLLSIYGCCIHNKEAGGNIESYTSIHDPEQGTYRPPITSDGAGTTPKSPIEHSEAPVREAAGFWVYVFQVQFQTCAGAVVLTDIVFWALIYPFTNGYKLSFLDVCMHSLNAVFLLGDTCLNSLVPSVPDLLLCTLELHLRGVPMDNPCLQKLMVLGSDSDAYTVLCRLRFGHKDEAFLATASKLMIVLG